MRGFDAIAQLVEAGLGVAVLPEQPLRLSADALFGFDSAVVTAEGRARIEGLLQQAGMIERRGNLAIARKPSTPLPR